MFLSVRPLQKTAILFRSLQNTVKQGPISEPPMYHSDAHECCLDPKHVMFLR